MTTPLSDEELLDRQRDNQWDSRPFAELVQRYERFVRANCRSITGSPSDAEDLAQEVFVKAYFALERFERRASFRTWIRRIKVNHCLNFLRKSRGVAFVDIAEPGVEEGLAVALDAEARAEEPDEEMRAEQRRRVLQALEGLNDTLRVPLVLCDVDGLSYEAIAEELGIGLSAVKMRIKRGRAAFRQRYLAPDENAPMSKAG